MQNKVPTFSGAISPRPSCLIVEDEPEIAAAIMRALGQDDIKAEVVASVTEMVACLQESHPRLLFLDISLKDSDGIEAIQELSGCKFSGSVQLISGHRPEVMERIVAVGRRHGLQMRPPIHKPFRRDQVRAVVSGERLNHEQLSNRPFLVSTALREGWLELFYQPKVDLQARKVVGAEGLVRARHPEFGLSAPSAFLPDASAADKLELTMFVIVRALRDWSMFASRGANLRLAVNVPVSAFRAAPLVQLLREERPKDSTWPGLIFEITEDEAFGDVEEINETAIQLGLYGVALAIDDFGSGFSSMARLRDLRCEELKIDRYLVANCGTDPRIAVVCESVIKLAHDLEMKVVAEGIENVEDASRLRQLGCDLGQGFLFAPGLEGAKFLKLVQHQVPTGRMNVQRRRNSSLAQLATGGSYDHSSAAQTSFSGSGASHSPLPAYAGRKVQPCLGLAGADDVHLLRPQS